MILVSSYTESFRCNSHFTSWAQHYTFLLHDQSEIPKRKRNLADDPTVVSISILGSPATQQGYKFVSRGKNYFENLPKVNTKTFQIFPKKFSNILKTFQRYRGQPEVSQPSRILGAAWEKKRSMLKYFWSLLTWGNHLMIWWSTLYFVVDMFAYMGKPSARTAPTSGTSRLGSSILGIRSEGRRTITT